MTLWEENDMSYQEIFSSIEDVWMEKKNISQHVMNDGGVLKDVSLDVRKEDNEELTRRVNENNIFVFPSPIHSDRPMTANKTFKRVSDETGFIFTAHDLRRTVAIVVAERGYDISSIGAVLNHSRQGVTEGYIQRTLPRLKQILIDIEEELF